MLRYNFYFVLLCLSVGCAVVPISRPSFEQLPETTIIDRNPVVLIEGAQIKITDKTFDGPVQAVVGTNYHSALGLECYRVQILGSLAGYELLSLCRQHEGHWMVTPRIWSTIAGSD